MKWHRDTYIFSHPEAKSTVAFKAWSEARAWKKMRGFVLRTMVGDWALFYPLESVEKVMRDVKLEGTV